MDSSYLSCLGVFATRQSSHLCGILVVLLQMQYIFSAPIPPHTLLPTFQDSENPPIPLLSSLHMPTITKDASDLLTSNPNVKLPAVDVLSFVLSLEEAAERGELTSVVVLPLLHGGQTTTPAVTILLSTSTPIERLSSTSFQVFSTPQPQKNHEDLFNSGPTVSTSSLDTITTPHLAPGIAVSDSKETAKPTPTTLIIPSSSPATPLHTSPPSSPSVSDLPSVTPLRVADDPDPESSSYRGLITAASVILALLVISAVVFILCSNRTLRRSLFWRANKDPSWPVAEKFAVSPSPSQTCSAEVDVPARPQRPTWMKLPSQNAALHLVRSPQASFASLMTRKTPQPKNSSPLHTQLQDKEIVRLKNKVVEIIPDFPRSRWSITSSDYSSSIKLDEDIGAEEQHQTTSDPRPPLQSGDQKQMRSANGKFVPVSLLTPEEFFSLPTSGSRLSGYSDCAAGYSSRCHRRRSSAPVFGRNRRVAGLSMASYKARASVGRCSVFVDGQEAKETVEPTSINRRPSEHRKLHSVATMGGSQWI